MDWRKKKNIKVTQEDNILFVDFLNAEGQPAIPMPESNSEEQKEPNWLQVHNKKNVPMINLLDQQIIHLEWLKNEIQSDIIKLQKSSRSFYTAIAISCLFIVMAAIAFLLGIK